MIRLTRRADYSVFVMAHLARRDAAAERAGRPPDDASRLASAQELASHSTLSKALVANLLKDLARASLLVSVRGVHGGYRLAAPAATISLAQILDAVEGPFALVDCVGSEPAAQPEPATPPDAVHPGSCDCALSPKCTSKGPLLVLHERIGRLFADLKLDELAGLVPPAIRAHSPGSAMPERPAHERALHGPATTTRVPTESPR